MHNTPEQNAAFRKAWDATNAHWKAGSTPVTPLKASQCTYTTNQAAAPFMPTPKPNSLGFMPPLSQNALAILKV